VREEAAETKMPAFLLCLVAFPPFEFLPDAGLPKPAWLSVVGSKIHSYADTQSPAVGLIELGDRVDVIGCSTSCEDPTAWALLSPFGAVRLSVLQFSPPQQEAFLASAFQYGRVRRDGTRVRHRPAADAKILRSYDAGQMVAYRAPVSDREWLPLVSGGFIQESDVTSVTASTFRGVQSPSPALAFARRDTKLLSDEHPGTVIDVARFSAFPVLAQHGKYLRVPEGRIARSDLLVALQRKRPEAIPAGHRWVHVDLTERVLTAYEGEQLVYSTLVSTGKPGWETPQGLFRVWMKSKHRTMKGNREPYLVEEVPFVLYFHKSIALHGALWHENFGKAVTHGCVNLSPADAQWLFSWSPPALPDKWHAILPSAAPDEVLWVQVKREAPVAFPADPSTE
jgi:lipoprotein-anchoring transpeptidase ErfK/SrfK